MDRAIISLAAHQERRLEAHFRSRAHEALDELLNRLEAQMRERGTSPPTLMELSETLLQERAGLTGALVEAFVERRFGVGAGSRRERPAVAVGEFGVIRTADHAEHFHHIDIPT